MSGLAVIRNHSLVPSTKKQEKTKAICNFHHLFVVIYWLYVAPFLTVKGEGSQRSWSSAMQRAFEEMKEKFTYSIYVDAAQLCSAGTPMISVRMYKTRVF
jgi:hypothetical protein